MSISIYHRIRTYRNFLMQFLLFSALSKSGPFCVSVMRKRKKAFLFSISSNTNSAMSLPDAVCICSRRLVPSGNHFRRTHFIVFLTTRRLTGCVLPRFFQRMQPKSLSRLPQRNALMHLLSMTVCSNGQAVRKLNLAPVCSIIPRCSIARVIA